MEKDFKIGDFVSVGANGKKGKIVNTNKPFGTYTMYTVHMIDDGTFTTCARHELIKGMSDSEFNALFDPFDNESSATYTAVPISTHSATSTAAVPIATHSATSTATTSSNTSPPPPILSPVRENEIPSDVADVISQLLNPTSTNSNSRFRSFSDNDIDQFIYENENAATRKKTIGHIKLLNSFLQEVGETREVQNIPPSDLDSLLRKFFVGVRQKNGDEYEPSYLRGMLGSFERYLKKK